MDRCSDATSLFFPVRFLGSRSRQRSCDSVYFRWDGEEYRRFSGAYGGVLGKKTTPAVSPQPRIFSNNVHTKTPPLLYTKR